MDTDCFVLRNVDRFEKLWAYPTIGRQKWKDQWRVNNAVLVFKEPHNTFLLKLMEAAATAAAAEDADNAASAPSIDFSLWGALGPRLLSQTLADVKAARGYGGDDDDAAFLVRSSTTSQAEKTVYNFNYSFNETVPRVVHWRWFYPLHFSILKKKE